jgi:hypothetical protein
MLLARYPDAIRTKDKCDERTPLHKAVRHGEVSVEGVELLIDACPENLTDVEHYGLTPLSMAITNRASNDMIHLLLNRGPQAARMKDVEGAYPLHHISMYRRYRRYLHIQSQIYSLYPEAIHKLDKCGHTPLHCACITPKPNVKEMRFLAERSVGSVILGLRDKTPYDLALSSSLEETEKQVVLDYMAMATKDTVCATRCYLAYARYHHNSSTC